MDFPTIISLTESELDLDVLLAQITLPTTGASAIFTGVVRGQTSRGQRKEISSNEATCSLVAPMIEKLAKTRLQLRTP